MLTASLLARRFDDGVFLRAEMAHKVCACQQQQHADSQNP
jgi:hypothetical protein